MMALMNGVESWIDILVFILSFDIMYARMVYFHIGRYLVPVIRNSNNVCP